MNALGYSGAIFSQKIFCFYKLDPKLSQLSRSSKWFLTWHIPSCSIISHHTSMFERGSLPLCTMSVLLQPSGESEPARHVWWRPSVPHLSNPMKSHRRHAKFHETPIQSHDVPASSPENPPINSQRDPKSCLLLQGFYGCLCCWWPSLGRRLTFLALVAGNGLYN